MRCPKCQFDNREGVKFCEQCGAKMELTCPNCGAKIPLGMRFCGECGHNLSLPSKPSPTDVSFDEKLAKIQRYLPKSLTEKILAQKDKIEGERKQVTVMFCDMEGFTRLSERLGPEEAYAIMDQVYEILIHRVHDYEGTVNEMTGDGIMALFGAPIALEDAPQRAIRSGYAIHREMARFSDRIKQRRGGILPIKMRIGIHTGPVVVGTLGNDLRVEFKAVGDTVNLASRMEGLAEPGTTYVTEETFRLTEGFFRFEALGAKEVKGKQELVKIYRVIAPSTRRTRFDVSAERGLTPFVGRERELELLLDGFERSKAGRGQAFSIIAEAGVGKSRLLYEFRKAVSSENVTFLEGRCFSYSRGVAYHPHIDILKSNFDIEEGDRDFEIREKVEKGLNLLGVDEASTLPYLLELLAVKESGIDKIPLSPEARKERIIEALKRVVLKGSEIRPLIMAVEDLHWIDKSSEESAKDLLDSISGARVLLIFTYRPEFVHTWGGRSYHSQLNLNRLSNRESLRMVSHLLGTEELDPPLEALILEKTEGVPFFIEELLKSLKDLKIIQKKDNRWHLGKNLRDVTIPSTIQDVIMARVDSMPEGAKEVLRTGSVIEREFGHELIERVAGLPEQELLAHLSALKDSELIYERGIYPQSTYVFKHALTREVVYNSLLTSRKRKLHERIGRAIERLYTGNIDEQCGVLTEHFIRSENYEKAAEYSELAGKKAARAGSYSDAIEYGKKRVFCVERLPKTDATQRKIIDARTVLAGYYTTSSRLVEAKKTVAPIVDLALKLNYQKRLPGIHIAIGLYSLWVEEDHQKGFGHLDEVSKISEKADDPMSFYMPLWFSSFYLGSHLSHNCEFERSLESLVKCLDLSRAANDLIAIPIVTASESLSYSYQGKIDRAHQISEETLQMAKEIGAMFVEGTAFNAYGMSCYYKGLFDEAETSLLKGLDFCERTGVLVWGSLGALSLGDMYFDLGKYEEAKDYYQRGLSILEPGKMLPSMMKLFEVAVARVKVLEGDRDVDLSELVRYYKANKFKVFQVWMARYIGEILLNIDEEHISDAENWIKEAIETDKRNGMRWFLAGDYALYAELYKRKGMPSKAKEKLKEARDIFKECGADGWAKKAEKELAALS
ncbi:MAG: AAA family ATPase [Proteobacteria bacterium]|nr:AAA family ATPase [Pseudomonadota bacterium]NIS70560.1 AAA family ATPase [Pseudomonadota bacterium]